MLPHQQTNGQMQGASSNNTGQSMLNRQSPVGGERHPASTMQRSMNQHPPNGNGATGPPPRPPHSFGAATLGAPHPGQGPPKPGYPPPPQDYNMQRRPSGPHQSAPSVHPQQQQDPFRGREEGMRMTSAASDPYRGGGHFRPSPPPPSTGLPRPSSQEEMRMNPMQAATANRPPPQPQVQPQQQQTQQQPQQPRPQFHPSQGPPPQAAVTAAKPATPQGGMRELRVEDALIYLDDVKREFGDRPKIYNEFLEIMKNFKSQEVDTPGVIDRVSRLFRGYNKLILGFNKFLPDGYKISLQDLERLDAQRAAQEARERQMAAAQGGGASYFPGGQARQLGQQRHGSGSPSNQQVPTQSFAQKRTAPQGQVGHPAQGSAPMQQAQQQRHMPPQQPPPVQQQQHQAVEFDHAISYVTNIKKRFANDPGTYHAFLEILHTYQKEQRGIKEVLEQVAALFADHPDLLKEFTFFLPDAVQEQAKERLHRAAADSEARMAAQARGEVIMSPSYGGMRVETGRLALQQAQASSGGQKFIDMTGQRGTSPVGGRGMQARKRSLGPGTPGRAQGPAVQPETYVYNPAVERQFFDATKEALTAYTRDGGQAWAEFLKCLDMYAQEILSKAEMLNFVEPLLGKRNSELFEEFKRILAAAGTQSGLTPFSDDSWYSVPLSEIDFSRCRRCSPSYRALPRDYPDPPCTDRTAEEAKVLNDVWVSLPVGSEESYTFRHMRRNQYEEMLFRVEDERFEIDMVIDSNAATLRRLEPIAEEIMQLSQPESITPDLASTTGGNSKDDGGMGGVRYQYTFDRTILGVVHRNCITRIYGDAGQEMLDLIMKNPTVAVPIVVQRLRQKDKEWRAVRERLNRHWKELAEANYYKSLDHRSLTWRTVDKRATSTRTLISEIKDRAANGGKESEASLTARMDKCKEEHGSFYEVTMKERMNTDLDLTNLPKPERGLFTPHLSFMLENSSWVMRDAFRILSFALERGNNSPLDKERGNRLWRDFLGPWFGLSLSWMQRPALSFKPSKEAPSVVSNGDESGREDDEDEEMADVNLGGNVVTEEVLESKPNGSDTNGVFAHHPIPAGSVVSTLFGEGTIEKCRSEDNFYVVSLPFGTACLQPNVVLCTVLTTEKSAYTNQLREQDPTTLERGDDMMVIGTQSLYLFFRLFHLLVRRLNIAKRLAYNVPTDQTLSTLVEQMADDSGHKRYEAYLSLVYALIDGGLNHMGPGSGSIEGGKYEDRVRCLLGHGAYELATMDKLISHILKNMQTMGNDETMKNLVKLFRRHLDEGSFKPDAYRQEAAYLSDREPMYGFQICNVPKSDSKLLHMDYMGVLSDSEDESMEAESETPSEPAPKRQRR